MNPDIFEEKSPSRRGAGNSLMMLLSLFFLSLALVLVFSSVEKAAQSEMTVPSSTAAPAQRSIEGGGSIAVTLPSQYQLLASWGDLGPQLVAAGAIDLDRFVQLYANSGRPLSAAQKSILTDGSDEPIVIDFENARFVLNFFWALGLVNQNTILTEGPMAQASGGNIGRFASTGGWTLGSYHAAELYASALLIELTPAQQARLEAVTTSVYRPCCNNHTAFADCNHGMAMLGLLELLAAQDATVAEMFATAKAVNGFWFPQQALETAVFFKAGMGLDYSEVDPRMAVGPEVFSGSGYQQVHQWLALNDLLAQPQGGGNSCDV